MPTYLVSYDLRAPGRNYDDVFEYLKSLGGWARVLESVWAITTHQTAAQIRDGLIARTDAGDGVFVLKSGSEGAWRNTICTGEWLKSNL